MLRSFLFGRFLSKRTFHGAPTVWAGAIVEHKLDLYAGDLSVNLNLCDYPYCFNNNHLGEVLHCKLVASPCVCY